MRKLLQLAFALLAFSAPCFAQVPTSTGPLSPTYAPAPDCNAAHYASSVGISGPLFKLQQTSGSPPSQPCAIISGTQNEFVDFQVHYQDPGSGTTNFSVAVNGPGLVQTSPSSYTISASTTPPPNITVYRENYMDVTFPTNSTAPTFYGAAGWYPDMLVPAVDPYWGQTTNAFPVNVPAGANQSVWVDILIPCAAPSGFYSGTVTVTGNGGTIATLPIVLSVWQWPSSGCMPSTTTLKIEESGFGYNYANTQGYLGNGEGTLPLALTQVSVSGGTTTYSGTITGGASNALAGLHVSVLNLLTSGNNTAPGATFTVLTSTASQFTVTTTTQSNETDPGLWQLSGGATTQADGYPGSGGGNDGAVSQMWADETLLMCDNRFCSGGDDNSYPQAGSFAGFVTLVGPGLNGTANLHGGVGSTTQVLPGAKRTSHQIEYTSISAAVFNNWQANFVSNSWGALSAPPLYFYLKDEPHTSGDFSTICTNYATYAGYPASGTGVPELVTTDLVTATSFSAQGCIDWMVVPINVLEPAPSGPIQSLANYATWLTTTGADGVPRLWWSYDACSNAGTCSNSIQGSSTATYPNKSIDGLPVANRAMEWMTFKHGQTGELYFSADICEGYYTGSSQHCGIPEPLTQVAVSGGVATFTGTFAKGASNALAGRYFQVAGFTSSGNNVGCYISTSSTSVVTCPATTQVNETHAATGTTQTFDPCISVYDNGGWGDGTLKYTGGVASVAPNGSTPCNYMGSGVTTPIFLPSIRLKLIRDGVQDYEYLYKLTAAGQGTFVQNEVAKWITNSYTFNVNPTAAAGGFPSDITDVRNDLGVELHEQTYPVSTTIPTRPTGKIPQEASINLQLLISAAKVADLMMEEARRQQ
jgi:hypothetical protein